MIRSIAKRQGHRRSPHWEAARAKHLRRESVCQACGGTQKLQVHHKRPFHLHPELELEDSNLITLCEKRSRDCHFHFGHFFNWSWFNPSVVEDAARFRQEREEARKRAVVQ